MSLAVALDQPTEYDRAVAYTRHKPSVTAKLMARDLGIAPTVAKGFMARMAQEKIIAPPNDLGRALVIAAPRSYEELSARSGELASLAMAVSETTGIPPTRLVGAAISGDLQDIHDASLAADESAIPDNTPMADNVMSGAAQTRLRTIVERIERLEEDKAGIMADISEVYTEAKGEGFDVKILRKVIRLRKMDKTKRDEEETILDLYMTAIGDR